MKGAVRTTSSRVSRITDDGLTIERATADDRRQGKDVPGASQVAALTDWLRKAPEVEAVAALGVRGGGEEQALTRRPNEHEEIRAWTDQGRSVPAWPTCWGC
jgi:hypothetical protein